MGEQFITFIFFKTFETGFGVLSTNVYWWEYDKKLEKNFI